MTDLFFNPVKTETRKFFPGQLTPRELVIWLLKLQDEGKIKTNLTSSNDSDIPNRIYASYYSPFEDEEDEYDIHEISIGLSNDMELDHSNYRFTDGMTYRNSGRRNGGPLDAPYKYAGWSLIPDEREKLEPYFNLFPHEDVVYREDLKNKWKKVQFPLNYTAWKHTDYAGRRVYGKPTGIDVKFTAYDFILAQDRHFYSMTDELKSEFQDNHYRSISGDCLIAKRLSETVVEFTGKYRVEYGPRQNDPDSDFYKITFDTSKMFASKPERKNGPLKKTLDGAFTEKDILFGLGHGGAQWYYINKIYPEEEKAELIKIKKEYWDVGKPYSIYKIYSGPTWKYKGGKRQVPVLDGKPFIADYTKSNSNKRIHWEAPEIKECDSVFEKWDGSSYMEEWVDHSG